MVKKKRAIRKHKTARKRLVYPRGNGSEKTVKMSIRLPEHVKRILDESDDPNEYIRAAVLHHAVQLRAENELLELELEGRNSGEPIALTEGYWRRKEKRLFKKSRSRK